MRIYGLMACGDSVFAAEKEPSMAKVMLIVSMKAMGKFCTGNNDMLKPWCYMLYHITTVRYLFYHIRIEEIILKQFSTIGEVRLKVGII